MACFLVRFFFFSVSGGGHREEESEANKGGFSYAEKLGERNSGEIFRQNGRKMQQRFGEHFRRVSSFYFQEKCVQKNYRKIVVDKFHEPRNKFFHRETLGAGGSNLFFLEIENGCGFLRRGRGGAAHRGWEGVYGGGGRATFFFGGSKFPPSFGLYNVRSRVNCEVQTVNCKGGQERGCRDRCQEGPEKRRINCESKANMAHKL